MAIKNNVLKTTIKNHFYYDWWQYAVAIVALILIWDFAVTILTKVPDEKLMEIYLVNDYIEDPQKLDQLGKEALKFFPELQQISFIEIPLMLKAGEMARDPNDVALQERLAVTVAAQQGDVFLFSADMFDLFASQGLFKDLDEYVADGTIKVDPSLLHKDTINAEGLPSQGERIYGISVEGNRLLEETGYDTKGKIIGITAYSKKIPLAIRMINWILANGNLGSSE